MKILFTICARSGSKGVKSKNTRLFLGKPLIEHTLYFSMNTVKYYFSKYYIDVVVSSNSKDVAEIVNKYNGVYFIKRPSYMSTDTYPKVPVIRHAAREMELIKNLRYDLVIDLDVTAPLRKIYQVEQLIQQAKTKLHKVVMSAVISRRNPYFNIVELSSNNAVRSKESDFLYRQAAPVTYDLTPSYYCFDREALMDEIDKSVFEVDCGIFQLSDYYVIDIDTEDDFETLEVLVKHKFAKEFLDVFDNL